MNELNQQNAFGGQGSAAEHDASALWIIVTQYKSNRIVYFTDDPDYQPPMAGDWYYCSTYRGALPDGMTLRNCWGWRFNGGTFTDAREEPRKSTQERLIESNKKALLQILNEKIDQIRSPHLPRCTGGEAVRAAKLEQARVYLNVLCMGCDEKVDTRAPDRGGFEYVQSVAVARGISMRQAAELIVSKSEEMQAVLRETERFREQLTQVIDVATTDAQLLEIREWLLERIYPELSRHFKLRPDDIKPIDFDVPLNAWQRMHEIARLKAQLRETINQKRAPIQSGYIQNDELRKQKARLAQRLLANNGVKEEGVDFSLLEAYAEGRSLGLIEAAQLIVNSMAVSGDLLVKTERIKDKMLARIDAVETLRDIDEIDRALKDLEGQL